MVLHEGQALEENPYRTVSEPYAIVGVLAEPQFGRIRLCINGEKPLRRASDQLGPLLRQTRAVDGRWTVDAWTPLEGRNINAGVRIQY